jgi:tetratricopeptide (TPR) repeat protein
VPDLKLRLLHLSDLHERGPREAEPWRRRRVLGDAWQQNLDEIRRDGPVDLVCFTGDLAHSGRPDEYAAATDLLADLLARLDLPWERLFVIPGNHDVQRRRGSAAWRRLRELLPRTDPLALSRWLAGGDPPPGGRRRDLSAVLSRQAAYRAWLGAAGRRPDLLPRAGFHPHLGYRSTLELPRLPFPVHVIGLDSAWMCGGDDDAGRLWLTGDQPLRLASDAQGNPLAGLRLVLVHHPLTDLADCLEVRRLLAERGDLLLRGHLHVTEPQSWSDPGPRRLREAATGCLYEGGGADQYPHACQVVTVTCDAAGRPQRYDLWFRGWSSRGGHWQSDNGLYRGSVDGRLTWWTATPPAAALVPAPAAARVFVGRGQELAALAGALLAEPPLPPVSVQGMAGIGKTYLVERFAALHPERFPGGYRRLALDPLAALPAATDLLGRLADELRVSPAAGGLAERLRGALLAGRALLHLDNVDSRAAGELAARLAAALAGCPFAVTGRLAGLGADAGWAQLELARFDEPTALGQLAAELRLDAPLPEHAPLARALGGLPLALHLAAGHLRAGYSAAGFLDRLRATGLALPPWDVADPRHAERERAVLDSAFTLSLDLLATQLGPGSAPLVAGLAALGHAPASGFGRSLAAALAGLAPADFEHLAVTARSLSLLEPLPRAPATREGWRLHPLLAELLRARGLPEMGRLVLERATGWFTERLPELPPGQQDEQGRRWKEVQAESEALVDWLSRVPAPQRVRVERAGSRYAIRSGPFHAWLAFCEAAVAHVSDEAERSDLLWTLGNVALSAGSPGRALSAAREKQDLDRRRGDRGEGALAAGLVADVLASHGKLDEALRIRREEELPVYEALGEVRERAVTLGKIADVLASRGELDEALRIRREEELPVYEALGDVHSRAVTLGKIAAVLASRGELDEALRIRREEELPVYEALGAVRSRAVTLGKIADVLAARGELDEALRIRREEVLPVFGALGDVRERAVTLAKIADVLAARGQLDEALRIYYEEVLPADERLQARRDLLIDRVNLAAHHLRRAQPGDRETAVSLLTLALAAAESMRLPEAETIRSRLRAAAEQTQAPPPPPGPQDG